MIRDATIRTILSAVQYLRKFYTHDNGKCDPQYPSDKIEIGSNEMYCNNFKYQAACCDLSVDGISLYGTTEWSQWPKCDKGECSWVDSSKDTTLVSSASGSGVAYCQIRHGLPRSSNDPPMDWEERKLCYKGKEQKSWKSCDWYMTEGSVPPGQPSKYCSSTCPSSKVRVAMDTINHCPWYGAAAFCCTSNYYTEKTVQTVHVSKFKKALDEWIDDPICPEDDDNKLDFDNASFLNKELVRQPCSRIIA